MEESQVNALIKLGLDEEQAKRTIAYLKDMQAAIDKLKQGTGTGSLGSFSKSLQGIQKDAEAASKAFGQTVEQARKGFNIEGLRRTGSALGALGLGDVGSAVGKVGDIAQVGKEADQLAESVGPLAKIFPVAAGAALGFQGAMLLFHDQAEKNNEIVRQSISQLDAFYGAIGTGTTKSLQARILSLQSEKDIVDKELGTMNNTIDGAFESAQKASGDLGARLLFAAAQTGIYGDTLKDTGAKTDELKKRSMDLGGQIAGLKEAMGSAAVQANDLAEAVRQSLSTGIANDVKQLGLLRTGTSDQVKEEIARRQDEASAIRDRLPLLEANASKSKEDYDLWQKNLALYNADIQAVKDLTDVTLPMVEAREAEAKRIKDLSDAAKQYGQTMGEITKAQADRDRDLARRSKDDQIKGQRDAITKDYEARIAAAKQKEEFDEKAAKINADYQEGELKALADYREQEEKATADANKQRLRTLKEAEDDLTSLAASRDVAGFIARKKQLDRDLEQQKDDQDDASRDRKAAYLKQRREAEDHYHEELNQLRQAGQKKLGESDRLEGELVRLKDQWARQDQALARQREAEDYAARIGALTQHMQEARAVIDKYLSGITWGGYNEPQMPYLTQMAANYGLGGSYSPVTNPQGYATASTLDTGTSVPLSVFNQSGAAVDSFIDRRYGGGNYPSFEMGGVMRRTGLARLHAGEIVYNPRNGGGAPINVTVQVNNPIGAKNIIEAATVGALQGVRQAHTQASGIGRGAL